MARYIAFLRGINVSGQKLIKMDELAKIFASMKFKNVKTYIQSGNVLFDSPEQDEEALLQKIEKILEKSLGYKVPVCLRTLSEIEEIVKLNPLKDFKTEEGKFYVVFLNSNADFSPELPHYSPKNDVKIFDIMGRNIFCLSLQLPNGTWGFPNAYIEKSFKVPATTRNWNTVNKVLALK